MFKTILFDLDGTLLPMDTEKFTKAYFGLLSAKFAPLGYDPKKLMDTILKGIDAMMDHDGSRSNETVFWETFTEVFGQEAAMHKTLLDDFYRTEFQKAQSSCGFTPKAREALLAAKAGGRTVVLATQPIFPQSAIETRIRWAGLEPEDFALRTSYEMIGSCKPNPAFFRAILHRLDADPAETLMVGNDADEDFAATEAGCSLFLLTDCLINRSGRDISNIPHGGYDDLIEYLKAN